MGSNSLENMSVSTATMPPPPPLLRSMGVDFLIDPVSLGWYRSLRVLRRVLIFISNLQARLGKKNNISSRYSSESDLEKAFFQVKGDTSIYEAGVD